MKFAFCRISIY